jgi:hypothetical protein
MFWVIYGFSSAALSLIVAMKSTKNSSKIFVIFLVIFLTPAQIEVSGSSYAPSLLTFFFNIIFQQDFSIRPLRPLFLTLPFCLASLFLFSKIKKRFF